MRRVPVASVLWVIGLVSASACTLGSTPRSSDAIGGLAAATLEAVAMTDAVARAATTRTTEAVATTSTLDMTTWSVVAADPETGDVGIAMASCVPSVFGDAVGALVPGKGAAAIQAGWDLTNRNRVFEALKAGLSADEVVSIAADPEADSLIGNRQYGVATITDGSVEVAGFTGEGVLERGPRRDPPSWAGVMADASMGVTAQGNTLVGHPVVGDALAAFQRHDVAGRNTMADRLMRALEAGSIAGGDVRCNNEQVVQTAATAMILVARGGDEPYAAADINVTDMGSGGAPWLAISVNDSLFGANPIVELRRRFDEWRASLEP